MALAVYNSAAFKAESGLALAPNATVEVRRESDSGLAGLFSDEAGTIGITNPSAFADSEGRFVFYVVASVGGYSIKVTSDAETYTLNNVAIGLAAQYDTDDFPAKGDTTAIVKGSADATKLLREEVDGFTASTTRIRYSNDEDHATGVPFDTLNLTLVATVGSSALTVALKTKSSSDPSAASPVFIKFRNATIGDGTYETVAVVAAESFVASSGSTLGTVSAVAHRIYIVGINDGGTFRLGLWNPYDATVNAESLQGIDAGRLYSATNEGGAGAADSAQVLYSDATVTTKAIIILGYIESTQATAGTLATAPSKIHMLTPGDMRTGDIVQIKRAIDAAFASGTTRYTEDDSIPQAGETDNYLSKAITPTSAINLLSISGKLNAAASGASNIIACIFQDSDGDALATGQGWIGSSGESEQLSVHKRIPAGQTTSTTFKLNGSPLAAVTFRLNGPGGSAIFGGAFDTNIQIDEVFV